MDVTVEGVRARARERSATGSVLFLLAMLSAACASTPKQAVQLSATVGRDVATVRAAHVALARQYFDRIDADVDAFVDQTYRPYLIRETLRKFDLVGKLKDPGKARGLDPLDVAETYVEGLTAELGSYRAKLHAPVQKQRAQVLETLEAAYRQIQDGNAIVTGHLASIVSVQDAQDEVLSKAGLAGLRETLVDQTARLSDTIAEITREAQAASDKAAAFSRAPEKLESAVRPRAP
ncbi:MAG TPA: hypothetical protein VFD38_02615 [Myxococcaceae bacterium]|nr:hypothetical protein [Myxococcaceae bacterium]